MENRSFIGLGSNIESRTNFIKKAVDELNNENSTSVITVSSLYETKPYGFPEQENFLNCVIEIKTSLSLTGLFEFTKGIEKKLGRKKRAKWGPREIDLDILFFNNEVYSDEKLKIPHEDILSRDFVLVPLLEIKPDLVHPVTGEKISQVAFDKIHNNIIRKLELQIA